MSIEFHPLLVGAVELHVHSAPSLFPRLQTDWELVDDARRAGMSAIVLKAHEGQTYDRATLMQMKVSNLNVYGGLVCNNFVGGLNPSAVEIALRMGAKIIWMPTVSAGQHHHYYSQRKAGKLFSNSNPLIHNGNALSILDAEGKVLTEVEEIVRLIAEGDAILATGHLSTRELDVLIPYAMKLGARKILIQHVDMGISRIPMEMQRALAKLGCILEKCYLACGPDFNDISLKEMAQSITELSANSCAIVTDYGQSHNIAPVKALSEFIVGLLSNGITESQIEQMVSSNPKRLLGLA